MKIKTMLLALAVFLISFLLILSSKSKKDVESKSNLASESLAISSVSKNASVLLKEAQALEERGSLEEAKDIYQQLISSSLSSQEMQLVQGRLENISLKIVLSGISVKQSQIYEVKPNDSLSKIAKQFNTTIAFIKKSNNIKSDVIRTGMKLRIWTAPFTILIDKSQNTLILQSDGEIIKTYSVSTGDNNSTPIGTYSIINKLVDPTWYKDGKEIPPSSPDNILGTRWMGFNLPGYGIHGTTQPEHIGKQITEGCVRMRNEDVEELFDLIPQGTEVTIID